MASKIQVIASSASSTRAFKSEPNRLSNWTRHLNQSKSIRLRRASRRVATLAASATLCNHSNRNTNNNSKQQVAMVSLKAAPDLPQKAVEMAETIPMRQQPLTDLGRVSINQAGVDYDDARRQATAAAQATNTSGIQQQQHPMISSNESKSSCRNNRGHQTKRQLKPKTTTTTRTRIERERTPATGRGARHRSPLASLVFVAAVMVASIVCCANLIGQCNCDTNGNHNPFSGYRSASYGGYAKADGGLSSSSSLLAAQSPKQAPANNGGATQKPRLTSLSQLSRDTSVARRNDRPAKLAATQTKNNHMEKLLSQMADSVERQHLGMSASGAIKSFSKPSKFDSSSGSDERRETNSINRYEDFLRDIMASHDGGGNQPTKTRTTSTSNGGNKKPPRLQPASSKADHELRQIMLMHEHAAPISVKHIPATASAAHEQVALADNMVTGASQSEQINSTGARWSTSKLLAKLPKNLVSKAGLMSIGPAQVLNNFGGVKYLQGLQVASGAIKAQHQDQPSHSTTSTTTGSPFTPRATAKNLLMGPILGLGQMLMTTQPKPPVTASRNPFSRHVGAASAPTAQSSKDQPSYSQPANEFKLDSSDKQTRKSLATNEQQHRRRGATESAASGFDNSLLAQLHGWSSSNGDHLKSTTGSSNKLQAAMDGNKKSWLVDGATHLAQTYFKDSFRDLLTLSQLPILSGGPVSTAPSDLEPGGKKWLANKQAAEQMRGNRTYAMEDLLRYVYILTNVGVRRKRDPLKALGSNPRPYSTPLASALAGTTTVNHHQLHNKRPSMLSFLTNHKPITSLIKFPPPKTLAGTKLSSLLNLNGDHIKSRGVMWDMATDPTLAVTMFHLLERASVALPLGFLLMPAVHMIRHPLGGLNLGRILPARASHRSVDFEELAKRLDMMDKILSRSMRPTHREA